MTNETLPDEIKVWENPYRPHTYIGDTRMHIKGVRYTRADQSPVDVEQIKDEAVYVSHKGMVLNRNGWNACIDHLASKGYLRTPPDNSEALEKVIICLHHLYKAFDDPALSMPDIKNFIEEIIEEHGGGNDE